ncbi:MAG: hypothetical protein N3D84_01890 [Candidatus Woesearchaeota archaeon]|nr:hypothetical protein [Candidatus Woesearchaeota archaeon]
MEEKSDIEKLKKKMQKVRALLDFYEKLKKTSSKSDKEKEDIISKKSFTQSQILKLCIESKKIIKKMEEEDIV